MNQSSYVDEEGRYHAVLLPNGTGEDDAARGLPLGPPSLESLGLPQDIEVRLHNELFARRLFTGKDVRKRRIDVFGALQAALKVDIEKVVQIYLAQEGKSDARMPGFPPLQQPEVVAKPATRRTRTRRTRR